MSKHKFENLVKIMSRLRSQDGCPWDIEQTHKSLRPYLLEETYEVLEAIDNNDSDLLKEELGDLLLQVVFHAQMAADDGEFSIDEVIDGITEKLIRRHPHVFGDAIIKTAKEQTIHWEKIKKQEGKKSAIDGVPLELPSLTRARRVQEKASSTGFDWTEVAEVKAKIAEEMLELEEAVNSGSSDSIEDEFGDVLFALVNYGRFLDLDPEAALRRATNKFSTRFQKVEQQIKKQNLDMRQMSLSELDIIWETVKKDD